MTKSVITELRNNLFFIILSNDNGKICFHERSFVLLGKPKNISIRVDLLEKKLYIQKCDANAEGAIAVKIYRGPGTTYMVNIKELITWLYNFCKWENINIRLQGINESDSGEIMFDLEYATPF